MNFKAQFSNNCLSNLQENEKKRYDYTGDEEPLTRDSEDKEIFTMLDKISILTKPSLKMGKPGT